jgi:hypothetical protein
MALPLPRVVADVGPGGGLVTAMGGINKLSNEMLLEKANQIKNQYLPDKLRLANELAGLTNQYYGPNIQSQINERNALTQQYNINNKFSPKLKQYEVDKNELLRKYPFLNQPGGTGEIQRLMYLQSQLQNNNQQQNPPNSIQNLQPNESYVPSIAQTNQSNPFDYNKLIQQQLNKLNNPAINNGKLSPDAKFANDYSDIKSGFVPGTGRTQQYQTSEEANKALEIMERKEKQQAWKNAPANAKMNILAYANGAGIDLDEANRELSKGTSLENLYKKHGFDPKNPPEPDFLATTGNVTKLKDRQAALKEMNVISKFIKEGLGPYSQRIMQYSPVQIKEALAGKNEEQQAKFLAARGLVPELTGLRLMAANAKATVHAIKAMQDKSLMNIKIYESLVTPKTWTRAQDLMDKVLNKGMKKSVESYSHHKNEKNEKKIEKKDKATVRWNQEKQDFEEIK